MEENAKEEVYLEYGDIIKIYASSNGELHEQTFFIKYIDANNKISLINTSTLQPCTLYYNSEEPTKLRDESIEEIQIVWKSPVKGYIAQNGLEVHKWIDIYFGGDFPIIFTGEISEIQDDQMEVTLYPSLEVIYIDFEYKGLPEDKDIEKIVLRSKPKYVKERADDSERTSEDNPRTGEERDENEPEQMDIPAEVNEPTIKYTDMNESIVLIPENYTVDDNVTDLLHNMYIDANDIIFDTGEVEILNQIVEMDTRKKIYSLDEQVTNLLDVLLSDIPNYARTKSVMENIQRIISHFKYLRKEFSKMDEYGNIESPLVLGLKDKPLVDKIHKLSASLKWIIPVVSSNKIIYADKNDDDSDDEGGGGGGGERETEEGTTEEDMNDERNRKIYPKRIDIVDNVREIQNIQQTYFKNASNEGVMAKYPKMIKSVEKYILPYKNNDPPIPSVINVAQVNAEIEAIIDNFTEFKTIVHRKPYMAMQKYVIQKYNLGSSLTWMEDKKKKKTSQLTENETAHIKSFLMMPGELVRFSKIDLPTTPILTRSNYSQTYPMMYKLFNKRTEDVIERVELPVAVKRGRYRETTAEFDHEKRENDTNIPFLSNIKHFTIENDLEREEEGETTQQHVLQNKEKRYETFLHKMIPSTYSLISLLQRYSKKNDMNGYSMLEMVRMLEPFAIYTRNITYNSYVRIRFFVKNAITEWKKQYVEKQREYRQIRETEWEKRMLQRLQQGEENKTGELLFDIFKENRDFQSEYYSVYNSTFDKFIKKGTATDGAGAQFYRDTMENTVYPPQIIGQRTSEVLKAILEIDRGDTVILLLRILLTSLTIPEELIKRIEGTGENDTATTRGEMTPEEMENMKPSSCSRRYLTKVYKSLRELQNDNHKEIYYDKNYDRTPYGLLTKELKAKKDGMPADKFIGYFADVLVQKSGVPRNQSVEMATNIVRGKKPVVEGEYAILESYPIVSSRRQLAEENSNTNTPNTSSTPSSNPSSTPSSNSGMNEETTKKSGGAGSNENEPPQSGMVKTYYIRTRNVWKKDDTIENGDIFMDDNTLFCSLTQNDNCTKRTKTDVCQDTEEARREILARTRTTLYKEFDERVEESVESLATTLKMSLKTAIEECKKTQRMKDIQIHKYNKYAYDLGSIYKTGNEEGGTPAHQHSKWEVLLDKILSQTDFVKKQKDILIFTDRFTREPMVESLNESPYWYYCRETNLKLLPVFLYELAKAYVMGGSSEYEAKMKEVIRKYGTLSEDGDSIVDGIGGSGRVIQKMEFVEEELYDEAGFRIQTKTAIEKELEDVVGEAIGTATLASNITSSAPRKKERVFENETNEVIYNILTTLCRNMGISPEGIEDDVLRISNEAIKKIVVEKDKYEAKMKKVEKPKPYIQYKNQNIILIVGFVTLVAIQSAIPSFQPSTTVAGCVFSFEGFPFEGGEDGNTDGVRYLACVLNISKSSIGVWASIQSIKNPVQTFMDVMIKTIAKHVIQREDVLTMFAKKREYMLLNPNGGVKIPTTHSIQRWTTFLPPIVPFKVSVAALPSDFFQRLKRSLSKGDSLQWDEVGTVKSKTMQYSFSIIDYINQVVKKNDPILNTVSLTPFLQNSCCNDIPTSDDSATPPTAGAGVIKRHRRTNSVLEYFANKETNIAVYANIVAKLAMSLSLDNALSLANIFVHALDTLRQSTTIPKSGHSMENIYQSFIHYGKFDIETAPIPDYLKAIIVSKPPIEYNREWTIMEKIKYLKENGKNYSINELNRLLEAVNNNNTIEKRVGETTPVAGSRSSEQNTSSERTLPEDAAAYRFHSPPNVAAMTEYLDYLDDAIGYMGVVEDPLKRHLRAVLSKYQPNTMTMTDNEEIATLKNYLIYSNIQMTNSIFDFFDEYRGSIESKKIENAKKYIRDFTVWEDDNNERMQTMVKYSKNIIQEMSAILPTMIHSNKPVLKAIPTHWELSVFHRTDIEKIIESYYNPILKFMGDESIKGLLSHTMDSLKVLIAFANYIPVMTPLIKKAGRDERGRPQQHTFYSVFDKETVYLLFNYLFNSVLYEYIQKSNDPEVMNADKVNIRKERIATNERNLDTTEDIRGVEVGNRPAAEGDTYMTENERLNEIQLLAGSMENIKKKTVELLVAFLAIGEESKKSINKSYKTVSERVVRSKLEEKKSITDYFKNMTDDARKVEYTMKMLKLGRWNLGMQKGVFEYDKAVYDKEHTDIVDMLNSNGAGENALNDYVIQPSEKAMDVADLEREEAKAAENEYENEQLGIQHLGEDYTDGNYYGEDDIEEDRDFNDN
jgi:hypothetical protein